MQPHKQHYPTLTAAKKLSSLSLIRTVAVPLFLVAGPPLAVHFQNASSTDQLTQELLGRHAVDEEDSRPGWKLCQNGQSEAGLLLSTGVEEEGTASDMVTQILIYAVAPPDRPVMPWSPGPSSPAAPETTRCAHMSQDRKAKYLFQALPLQPSLVKKARQASGLCTPPPEVNSAFFLPPQLAELEAAVRRQRMSSVFDAASQMRRKSKAKGGESVSKAMASLGRSDSQLQVPTQASQLEEATQSWPENKRSDQWVRQSDETIGRNDRPSPAYDEAHGIKQPSLHRAGSTDVSRMMESTSGTAAEIADQNKTALSKIVMAGMRLHGLQQKKKPSRGDRTPHNRSDSQCGILPLPTGEDEYKQVYHQTLKSALFACRNHCNDKLLPQDYMRELVDRLLAIFCVDSLPDDSPALMQTPGLTSSGQERENPFDAPSSAAAKADINVFSTPVHKKRKRVALMAPD